jgi:hypothetical protein
MTTVVPLHHIVLWLHVTGLAVSSSQSDNTYRVASRPQFYMN